MTNDSKLWSARMNDLFENLFRGGLWLCAWALLTLSLPSFGQAKSDLAAAPFAESKWTIRC